MSILLRETITRHPTYDVRLQVSVKQRDTEADLAKAEPAVAAAMAALDTLNKKVNQGEIK